MKYIFRNASGYYKFCRKIPNTNIQFTFSLQTKNLKKAKKIANSFLSKSDIYYKMLQNMSKEEILERSAEIRQALEAYKEMAKEEYSVYEKTRQEHFTYNGIDGSHPEAIDYWLKEMQEHIGGRRSERQTIEFTRKILARSTPELKTFRKSLQTDDEKLFFMQNLIKAEADLLNIDYQRAQQYFAPRQQTQSSWLQNESLESILSKVLGQHLGTAVVEIDKEDAIQQYIQTPKIAKRMKGEAYMFNNTFSVLLQASDKRFFNEYDSKDFDHFMETFVWIPAFPGGRKSFITTIFGDDDFMLSRYFKKFYIENLLDEDEEDLPFQIDKDYSYDDEVFNNEELLEEFEKLDVQSTTTLKNKYTILKKFFEWCLIDKKYIANSPFNTDNDYKWMELINNVGNAEKTRNPYSNEEISKMLRTFIEVDFFQNENIAYFYIPIIALYSGMRIEEICKLKAEHIIKENDIYCFDIKPPVKTVDSIRKVPIHPYVLKNLRFLEYVKTRDDLLFDLPVIKVNGKTKYSKKYSAIFSEFRTAFVSKERITEDLISFHSFRHYFGTGLNNADVKTSHISALFGHKMAKNETVTYLKKDVITLNRSLNKLPMKVFKTEMDLITMKFSKVKFKKN